MASLEDRKWWWEQQKIAKKPSQEGPGGWGGTGNGDGLGKWGIPPQKVWWPPVLLIFI